VAGGCIPAGGCVKELLRRNLAPLKTTPQANPQPFVSQVFQTISQAKGSTSAVEARALGFLSERDRIVFNREQLIGEAKREVHSMVRDGYRAPLPGLDCYWTRQPLFDAYGNQVGWRGRPVAVCD